MSLSMRGGSTGWGKTAQEAEPAVFKNYIRAAEGEARRNQGF